MICIQRVSGNCAFTQKVLNSLYTDYSLLMCCDVKGSTDQPSHTSQMFATRRTFSFPVRTCLCSSDAQHALRQGQVLPSQPSPPTDTSFTTHLSCYHPAAVPKSFMNEAFVVVWSCTETARMPHKALNCFIFVGARFDVPPQHHHAFPIHRAPL